MAGFCLLLPRSTQDKSMFKVQIHENGLSTDRMVAVCWLIFQTTYAFSRQVQSCQSSFWHPDGLRSHRWSIFHRWSLPRYRLRLWHALDDIPSQLRQKVFFYCF